MTDGEAQAQERRAAGSPNAGLCHHPCCPGSPRFSGRVFREKPSGDRPGLGEPVFSLHRMANNAIMAGGASLAGCRPGVSAGVWRSPGEEPTSLPLRVPAPFSTEARSSPGHEGAGRGMGPPDRGLDGASVHRIQTEESDPKSHAQRGGRAQWFTVWAPQIPALPWAGHAALARFSLLPVSGPSLVN